MAEIIPFLPKKLTSATKNVKAFVNLSRDQLTIFGVDLDFDSNCWDVTEHLEINGRGGARQRLLFSNFDSTKQSEGASMQEPFLSFAKAYMRYMHGMRPTKSVGMRLLALRALERALSESGVEPAIENADGAAFNRASQLIERKGIESAYKVCTQLQMIAEFCERHCLTNRVSGWKNPLNRPKDRNRVGREADKRREDKLPSPAALGALPKIFRAATEQRDILISSIAALLCAAPDRFHEVLILPVQCQHWTEIGGKRHYGLRWRPGKRADPMIKWMLPSMVGVVQEAVAKIKVCTDESRKIASWYEANPRRLYLPAEHEYLREKETITKPELAALLGLSGARAAHNWAQGNNVPIVRTRAGQVYRFEDVEHAIVERLPPGFPVLDISTGLRYSEALFVVPMNLFHKQRGTFRVLIEPLDINTFNNEIGASTKHGKSSIFSRNGYVEPDGSAIQMASHDFRHWLNTLAQRGGLSQLDIAKWSGRKDVRQNVEYDHMTAAELLDKVRGVVSQNEVKLYGPIAERAGFAEAMLISREDFLAMEFPAAHTTKFGFCVNDYSMLPCQLHGDCQNCDLLVLVKGDKRQIKETEQALKEAEQQFTSASVAVKSGFVGAEDWVERNRRDVTKYREMLRLHGDSSIPDGAIVQLSTKDMSSQIRNALDECERRKCNGKDKCSSIV